MQETATIKYVNLKSLTRLFIILNLQKICFTKNFFRLKKDT